MPGHELFGAEERQAVLDLFDNNGGVLFAHGFDAQRAGIYRVREWESAFARAFNFQYAQAVSSGTAALRVALEAVGVGPGDEVITQAHTFIATVEAIVQAGATPVIVDIDETLNMDTECLETAITERTRAIIPVHMLGEMSDMAAIMKVASRYELSVIEDAAQALGASQFGVPAGFFGHAAAFSTDAGKTLSTGEGGMVVTQDQDIYERARALHDHGHAYQPEVPRGRDAAVCVGFNYRMTEIQAAIGLAQLQKLDFIRNEQRKNKQALVERMGELPAVFRRSIDPSGDAGDTLVFLMPNPESSREMVKLLGAGGISTKNLPDAMNWHFAGHWRHLCPQREKHMPSNVGHWPKSEGILNRCVSLGISVKMRSEDLDRVAEVAGDSWLRAMTTHSS